MCLLIESGAYFKTPQIVLNYFILPVQGGESLPLNLHFKGV